MPSAKGKPTDPKLKEKVTEEIKQQPNKDGSGKGQMAAWKAAKIGKEYEAQGGDYENEPGSKDKPVKGPPQKKSEAEKKAETSTSATKKKDEDKEDKQDGEGMEGESKKRGRPAKSGGVKKAKKEPREGERKSARVQAKPVVERNVDEDEEDDEEDEEEEKPAKKKGKGAAGKAK